MFFTNIILSDLCAFATLRAQFHAKAQRRKVYYHYLDCWYELRTVMKNNVWILFFGIGWLSQKMEIPLRFSYTI